MAPSADARISSSSVQPNRNAGSRRTLPGCRRTRRPSGEQRGQLGVRERAAQREQAPKIHTPNIGSGAGTRSAMIAGVRKMPPPMVEPTSTATALHRPSRRGSRSPQRSAAGQEGGHERRIYCASAPSRRPTA